MIPISHVLVLSALLFSIGVLGVMLRRNVIVVFMSIELMLNAVNLSFVGFARTMDDMTGVIFIFFIIVVAAAEAVVGLSIILSIYRTRKTLNIDEFNLLKW
ncbi:MAG: NADH-quinone oxidoreductase subunit NuoK [SAR324 cluster bacterium]|jgi:NADH-quinone oxidoreductase subunit K|nr:NADH-quinone oxidoreductase subunit NuoK [Deltaproteobacteria bacterium]MDP7157927.1 NADH-quinone oxidoreductase subunit NuoK [SAR324 cluster bacterium]HIF69470.1 NADH-quinone oxidoreductase subunit NuoK [Candidatus Lambdaproteobacteria bacterium]MAZ75241.1 NADH-quinone oxidoreductase subunit NuoK [Deltaproteobacteria bacterium]MBQ32288.1 NADH-quinone oxidoreductase subunit NuoK [Deltaproteobacteria bacterium]|tara:strand:+ start:10060 stop:10362 length:303 start_codon:yes stop_codon:yes gene_type:complete